MNDTVFPGDKEVAISVWKGRGLPNQTVMLAPPSARRIIAEVLNFHAEAPRGYEVQGRDQGVYRYVDHEHLTGKGMWKLWAMNVHELDGRRYIWSQLEDGGYGMIALTSHSAAMFGKEPLKGIEFGSRLVPPEGMQVVSSSGAEFRYFGGEFQRVAPSPANPVVPFNHGRYPLPGSSPSPFEPAADIPKNNLLYNDQPSLDPLTSVIVQLAGWLQSDRPPQNIKGKLQWVLEVLREHSCAVTAQPEPLRPTKDVRAERLRQLMSHQYGHTISFETALDILAHIERT